MLTSDGDKQWERTFAKFVAEGLCNVVEEARFVHGLEALEIFGERRGEAVVYLVASEDSQIQFNVTTREAYEAQRVSPPVTCPLKLGRVCTFRMA